VAILAGGTRGSTERSVPAGQEADARRIVSLIPAATEILLAIGAGDRLVGRTHWDIYPAAARTIPDVGDGVRPALELVVARQPDLVILYAGAGNAGVAERLSDLGVPTLTLHHDTLEDLDRNILALGEVTGCRPAAVRLQNQIREGLTRVRESVGSRQRPRVYYDVWADPPITVGRGSYLDALIQTAGGQNIFHDLADPSPQVSLEAIVARAPDVILYPVSRQEAERAAPAERAGWMAVPAVASGEVHNIDGDLAHRLGPRIVEAALEIARVLHPDASNLRELKTATLVEGTCR
jgi:ABC-type Fe3+-hydroxamate transport system substrate-binding protein